MATLSLCQAFCLSMFVCLKILPPKWTNALSEQSFGTAVLRISFSLLFADLQSSFVFFFVPGSFIFTKASLSSPTPLTVTLSFSRGGLNYRWAYLLTGNIMAETERGRGRFTYPLGSGNVEDGSLELINERGEMWPWILWTNVCSFAARNGRNVDAASHMWSLCFHFVPW